MAESDTLDLTNLPRFLVHLEERRPGFAALARQLLDAGWQVQSFWGPVQMDVWSLRLRRDELAVIFGIERGVADGVQLGTAFLLCPESSTDSGYREALKSASDGQTVLTSAISGRPARCLVNGWREINDPLLIPAYPVAYAAGKALASAA